MIFNYDFRYTLAQIPVNSALRINFRKFVITGKENIPKNSPVVFTPNHRNALVDALLLVYTSKKTKQVVFLARADIFKKRFIACILRGMRIVPIYRIRDGKDNLRKNSSVFDICGKILKRNNPIALFPEARHNPKQSLLPIQKATPRIVLPTEAQYDFTLGIKIVPVAIYYTEITGLLSDCYLSFGEPIGTVHYKELYLQNPNLAVNALRSDLENRMKEMVVNIQNDEYYNEYQCCIDWNREKIAKEKFSTYKDAVPKAAIYIVNHLDYLFENSREEFEKKIKDFRNALEILASNGLSTKDNINKPTSFFAVIISSLSLIISFPVALFGFGNSIFPILIYRKLRGLFSDKQFIPSVRYVSGLVFVPVFSFIQSIFIFLYTGSWLATLGYFVLMPASFLFAIYWRKWLKDICRKHKVNRFIKSNRELWQQLLSWISI